MNVSCPQCRTVFRVDPRKVPDEGVRARCSVCGGVFEVVAGGDRQAAPTPAGPEPEAEKGSPAPSPAVGEEPGGIPSSTAETPTQPMSRSPQAPMEPGGSEAPQAEPVAPAPGGGAPAFGQPDPEARARRLARALISDLAAYHPDRQDLGLREGRLKELFRDEIKKSWQEYVDQVGLNVAKGTPYFREALNEILAKGRRVF